MALRVITFKVDEEFLEEIDLAAKRLGLSRSDIIRSALESYLRKQGISREPPVKKLSLNNLQIIPIP